MTHSTSRKNLTNEELLKNHQQADAESFSEFFDRNHRLVLHFFLARLRNSSDAEEALQKTFLRIHRYILSYDPGRSALGWTFAIARRVALDIQASQIPTQELSGDEQHEQDDANRLELKQAISVLLSQLDPKDRELVERRYLLDEEFEEIAKREGMSPSNVRQRISRAIRRLRLEVFPF